jgi:hypothetical protein
VASWNNKQSNQASFTAFDTGDSTRWGLQHHVEAIEDYLSATGRLDLPGVARAGYRAAFDDTRVKWVMPVLLGALQDPGLRSACTGSPAAYAALCPRLDEVVAALQAWYRGDDAVSGGAERTWFNGIPSPWWDQTKGWPYDNGGQALWDSWWNVAQEAVFHRWFAGSPADYPGPSGDSMENGVDPFFIHALLGPWRAAQLGTLAPRVDYLSAGGDLPATQAAFQQEVVSWAARSMNDTLAWLAAPSTARPSYVGAGVGLPDQACCRTAAIASWRENMIAAGDMNCFGNYGVYSVPCMPWEDKGTYAQVVEVMRSAPAAPRSAVPRAALQLPNTAGGAAAPLAAVCAIALLLVRRPRRLRSWRRCRASAAPSSRPH